jgi:hypothetical protein
MVSTSLPSETLIFSTTHSFILISLYLSPFLFIYSFPYPESESLTRFVRIPILTESVLFPESSF